MEEWMAPSDLIKNSTFERIGDQLRLSTNKMKRNFKESTEEWK